MTFQNSRGTWRAIRASLTPERASVHFHVDADGRAFACGSGRCDLRALTLKEASLTETGARRRTA
jgi:hypothetical protein